MGTQISRIAPWQATKVFTIMYFIIGAAFATPMLLLTLIVGPQVGGEETNNLGIWFYIAMPFLYAIMGLILIPISCWLYNMIAKYVGGIEFTLQEKSDT